MQANKIYILFFLFLSLFLQISIAISSVDKVNFVQTIGSGDPSAGKGVWFAEPVGISMLGNQVLVSDMEYSMVLVVENGNLVNKIGEGKLKSPERIAVNKNNSVFVTDSEKNVIYVFKSDGSLDFSFGEKGNGEGEFKKPAGIAINSYNQVFIVDRENNRIQVFSESGIFIKEFGEKGKANSEFNAPSDIAIDDKDKIYITDTGNNRVQRFDSNGQWLHSWGREGEGEGKFKEPVGIAFDKNSGYIFVVDSENTRIQAFDKKGNYKNRFGSKSGRSGFKKPVGIFIDTESNIYISDRENRVIQQFQFTQQLTHDEIAEKLAAPPAIPSNLKGISNNNSIILSWLKNLEDDFSHYIIFRRTSEDAEFTEIAQIEESEYIDKNVSIGEKYYYKIKSVDATNNASDYSETIEVEIKILPPAGIEKALIAIFNFEDKTERGHLGEIFSDFLTTAFTKRTYFSVIERNRLKDIMEEHSLSLTGAIQEREEIGNLLKIDLMVLGSVSQIGNRIEVDARLVDVNTGEIIVSTYGSTTQEEEIRALAENLSKEVIKKIHMQTGYISGKVSPIPDDATAFAYQSNILRGKSQLDNRGEFTLTYLNPGVYNVEIRSQKYEDFSTKGIRVLGGEITTLSPIELTKAVISPAAPRGLFVEKHELGNKLSWFKNAEENIRFYNIYRSFYRDAHFKKIDQVPATQTTYLDAEASEIQDLYYKISAVNSEGLESELSEKYVKIAQEQEKTAASPGEQEREDDCALGERYYQNGDFEKAVERLEACLKNNPNNTNYLILLGENYRKLDQFDKAIESYEKVVALSSEEYQVRLNLAICYNYKENYEKAQAQVDYILNSEATDSIKEKAKKIEDFIQKKKNK